MLCLKAGAVHPKMMEQFREFRQPNMTGPSQSSIPQESWLSKRAGFPALDAELTHFSPRRHEEKLLLPKLQWDHVWKRVAFQRDQEDVLLHTQCGQSLEQALWAVPNARNR